MATGLQAVLKHTDVQCACTELGKQSYFNLSHPTHFPYQQILEKQVLSSDLVYTLVICIERHEFTSDVIMRKHYIHIKKLIQENKGQLAIIGCLCLQVELPDLTVLVFYTITCMYVCV